MTCKAETCPLWSPEGCHHTNPEECDLRQLFPINLKSKESWAPLYVRFTYKNLWRHIRPEETFAIWTTDDFGFAMHTFREMHQSPGALVVFCTVDLIDWKIWGEVPAEEKCDS
jgi:hypothetical protein